MQLLYMYNLYAYFDERCVLSTYFYFFFMYNAYVLFFVCLYTCMSIYIYMYKYCMYVKYFFHIQSN